MRQIQAPITLVYGDRSDEVVVSNLPTSKPLTAEYILGDGTGAIYLYYLPTYRLYARERGESVWPCKIGRTTGDPIDRILAQAATALPECPTVAVILRTSNPVARETALHGVLTLRGLRINESPGSEWFLTSPEEVLTRIDTFDPNLSDAV